MRSESLRHSNGDKRQHGGVPLDMPSFFCGKRLFLLAFLAGMLYDESTMGKKAMCH